MNGDEKPPAQSAEELSQLRSRVAELESSLLEALSERGALKESEEQHRTILRATGARRSNGTKGSFPHTAMAGMKNGQSLMDSSPETVL